MCTPPEFFVSLCAVLALPFILLSIRLQRRFNGALQTAYPNIWAELGSKGYFKHDESPKEAAAGWFLLTGQYHYVMNDELNKKGDWARWVTLAAVSIVCLGFLATALPNYGSLFACLPK